MTIPSEGELVDAIIEAARSAAIDLFSSHRENFYYFSLITTGEAHAPFVSAWSTEALAEASSNPVDQQELKWSYADSPYCCYGEAYFERVRELFARRPHLDGRVGADSEWNARITAMETALRMLDHEGLFGTGAQRNRIVINAEVMPPDASNTERAVRLNPPEALKAWLAEAAE